MNLRTGDMFIDQQKEVYIYFEVNINEDKNVSHIGIWFRDGVAYRTVYDYKDHIITYLEGASVYLGNFIDLVPKLLEVGNGTKAR